MNIMKLKNH